MQHIKPVAVVIQRCSVKKVFLKILQNSKPMENPWARVSYLTKLQLKKRLWDRCFPMNIAKFSRTTFLIEHFRWLTLVKLEPSLWNQQDFNSSYFWLHLILWALSTLRQNSCECSCICGGVHSCCNSKLKTFKLK